MALGKRLRWLLLTAVFVTTTTAAEGAPKAQVLDPCDGTERIPILALPVPADYDVCSLLIDRRRLDDGVRFTLSIRGSFESQNSLNVTYVVHWDVAGGCEQGWWRRARSDGGPTVEFFERCDGMVNYHFIDGVERVEVAGSKLVVVIRSARFVEGQVLQPRAVFTGQHLLSAQHPTAAHIRLHGELGPVDTAGPGRAFMVE